MPGVFHSNMTHKAADGFQPGIALHDRRPARRPIDCGLRVDMCLTVLGRKGGKALEQVLRVEHPEPSGTAQRQISLDGLQHQRASGQGCAICFRSLTSALA